ncbi:hypothetical protein B0T14DRAFT_417618 [Immersiella caudata]|uniref:Uncharacterized protein n=1 Tax=Immersiella caudata TaxID=314043 RepID=A0AA39XCS9_9PEZI|nr:hypothetical protein B0T14DRAFT_417618 [Immersiella caudata]
MGRNAAHHFLQSVLHVVYTDWFEEWSRSLDGLDEMVTTEFQDIVNYDKRDKFMFDSGFQRSRVYFETLQLLRIFTRTIRLTRQDLLSMAPDQMPPCMPPARVIPNEDEIMMANWKILWSSYTDLEEKLLKRIAEKKEEIQSLRDGLFNATSLREASRSTAMNRYIIVFTIVTVLYLPPTLIAVSSSRILISSSNGRSLYLTCGVNHAAF